MRLIDADALPKYTGYALSANEVAEAVENAPTIDAVPVVRCRECAFFDGTKPGQPNILCFQMHENDYCSYGERKDGAKSE